MDSKKKHWIEMWCYLFRSFIQVGKILKQRLKKMETKKKNLIDNDNNNKCLQAIHRSSSFLLNQCQCWNHRHQCKKQVVFNYQYYCWNRTRDGCHLVKKIEKKNKKQKFFFTTTTTNKTWRILISSILAK